MLHRNAPKSRQPSSGPHEDAPSATHASDIVELVVFTNDATFLETLREAVRGSRRLWHVASADKVGDLLLAGQVGILVVDVPTLQQAASAFVSEIKRQFPDLIVLVAGDKEAESWLSDLIMEGTIYRFLHKPMSPGRAKLFTDAAVRKYSTQRASPPAPPLHVTGLAFNRRLLIGAIASAILAALVAVWALRLGDRNSSSGADRRPDPHSADRAHDVVDSVAPATVAEGPEVLLARAENALVEERLSEAARAIDAARRAGANTARTTLLAAQLAKARERLREAARPAVIPEMLPTTTGSAADDRLASPEVTPSSETSISPSDPVTIPALPEAVAPPPEAIAPPTAAIVSPPADEVVGSPEAATPTPVTNAEQLTLIRAVKPLYPLRAEQEKLEGWVDLDFVVTELGAVQGITVRAATPPGIFEAAAVSALSQWRYKPPLSDGKPMAQHARVRIRFALSS